VAYSFSKNSLQRLETCTASLQKVCARALSYGVMDFTVLEGHRTVEQQQEYFRTGRSKIDGINKLGKHNHYPSLAVDIAPFPVDWDNKLAFHVLAGLMFAAASEEGVKLRWGGDWDGDFSAKDQSFHDLPHFEIAEK
jgi:peptidoglycan L-alanyl-D-glutamate endopeptidase CwlK